MLGPVACKSHGTAYSKGQRARSAADLNFRGLGVLGLGL